MFVWYFDYRIKGYKCSAYIPEGIIIFQSKFPYLKGYNAKTQQPFCSICFAGRKYNSTNFLVGIRISSQVIAGSE